MENCKEIKTNNDTLKSKLRRTLSKSKSTNIQEISKNVPPPLKIANNQGPDIKRKAPQFPRKPSLRMMKSERNLFSQKDKNSATGSLSSFKRNLKMSGESPQNIENLRRLIMLRNSQKNKRNSIMIPQYNAKEKWKQASKVISAIHRFGYIAKEIQLYGNPAFSNDKNQYRRLIHEVTPDISDDKKKVKKKKAGRIKNWFILSPNSTFKLMWTIIMIFVMLYAMIIQPLRLAFVSIETKDAWFIIQLIIDIILFIDILISCCSAYYGPDGILVTKPKIIIVNYIKSIWFLVDLLAAFPYSLVFTTSGFYERNEYQNIENNNQKWFRLYELLKMLVILKWIKGISKFNLINLIANSIQMNMSIFQHLFFKL